LLRRREGGEEKERKLARLPAEGGGGGRREKERVSRFFSVDVKGGIGVAIGKRTARPGRERSPPGLAATQYIPLFANAVPGERKGEKGPLSLVSVRRGVWSIVPL